MKTKLIASKEVGILNKLISQAEDEGWTCEGDIVTDDFGNLIIKMVKISSVIVVNDTSAYSLGEEIKMKMMSGYKLHNRVVISDSSYVQVMVK